MGDHSSGSLTLSGFIYHQTFSILAADTNGSTSPGYNQTLTAKFQPSMAIIIIVLISAFLFMGFFSIYVRKCTSSEDSNANATRHQRAGNTSIRIPGQGLDKAVVDSLPLVGYSLVKGLKGGKDLSECAVCLSEFEEDENLRLLPKCGHIFHPDCIDMWFFSHTTCPLCRSSLVPNSDSAKDEDSHSQELAPWVNAHGATDSSAITIHDGPPVPPNGSMLELLSREGAESILAGSLRRDGERLDPGLARREGDEHGERAVEMRALNRALSKNSASFRLASRGVEVSERISLANDSGRFNPSTAAGTIEGNGNAMGAAFFEKRERKSGRLLGSSHSFNMALRRSSSVGSSGRYIRQLFGANDTDNFSLDSEQDGLRVDRTRLLSTEQRLPSTPTGRREHSDNELQRLSRVRSVQIPVWDNIDLNGESTRGAPSPISNRSANYPGSGGRKFLSGELTPNAGARRVDLQGEASGPLFMRRKGKESVEERTKSDRWTFGQSLRRTFSLRRTNSDSRDRVDGNVSSSQPNDQVRWYSHMMPGSSAPAPKSRKFASPWAGAMKNRRTASVDGVATSLTSHQPPPPMAFPQSLPVQDQQQQGPAYQESIQIITQP